MSQARGELLLCPECGDATRVLESKASDDSTSILRRRGCVRCCVKFYTVETIEERKP